MRHRLAALGVVLVAALAISGSALAFDCIRVSSSLQGLKQSTQSGNWLLFDFSSAAGVQETFANVFGGDLSSADAQCFANAYATYHQPLFFALGVGVAGGKKESTNSQGARAQADGFGVIAWNGNEVTLSDGKGIDHIDDSPIFPAVAGAAETCGITLPDGE